VGIDFGCVDVGGQVKNAVVLKEEAEKVVVEHWPDALP
jgi:hypothetical protein